MAKGSVAPGSAARRPRSAALTLLSVLLMIAEPLGVAFYASGIVTRVAHRGAWAVLLLVVRLAITAIDVAAGLALWHDRPGAMTLARVALAFTAVGVLITSLSPVFPHNQPPGTTWPLVTALLIYYGAWFAYLTRLKT